MIRPGRRCLKSTFLSHSHLASGVCRKKDFSVQLCGISVPLWWNYPWMKSLGDGTLKYALVNVTIRLLVWVLPVFLYLKFIDQVNPIEYLKLRQNWKRG